MVGKTASHAHGHPAHPHPHPLHGPGLSGLRQRWWKRIKGLNRIVIKHEPFEHYFFRYYLLKNGWDAISAGDCPTNLTHPLGLARYIDLSVMCTTSQNFRCALWLIFGSIMVAKKGPRPLWVFTVVFLTLFYLLYCTAKWSSGVLLHSTNLQSLAMLGYMFVHLYYAWIDFRRWWSERQKRGSNLPITKEEFAQREETYEDDISVAVVQQVTACGYFMSAITKVLHSGTWWKDINQVVYIAKANAQAISSERTKTNDLAEWFIGFSLSYPTFVSIAFLGAFSIEVLALVGFVWNRVLLFLGGIALYLLHYGIKVLMRIDLPGFRPLVNGFYLNPAYWTVMILLKLRERFAPQLQIRLPFATDHGTHKTKWTWLLGQRRKVRSFSLFPLWPAFIVCALCLYFGENYPFTPFGMYSAPKGSNWYYSITDGDNRGLKTLPVLGASAGKLKKLQWSTHGKDILEYFIHNAPPESQLRKQPDSIKWPLKLWKVSLHLQDMPDGSKQLIWDPPLLMESVNLTATTPEFQTEVLYRRLSSKEKEALGLPPKEPRPPRTPKPSRTREERRREREERRQSESGKGSGNAKRSGGGSGSGLRSKLQKQRQRRKETAKRVSSILATVLGSR